MRRILKICDLMKPKERHLCFFVGCVLAAGFSSAAMAKSVSWKELVGKKVCWDQTPFGRGLSRCPRLLYIEITESMAMRDSARSEAIIRQIRALGVHVSIDDFGAGHSSMARLKHLSIDGIKIDRGFVRGLAVDVRDRAIVEAICALGHALQLKVVGEGVETAEQKALLAQLHCDEIQGFLFAPPMLAEQIPDFVRKCALGRLGEIDESSRRSAFAVVEELGARVA